MTDASGPVVLTGATGYLGSCLARALIGAGHALLVVKRRSSDTRRLNGLGYRAVDVEDGLDGDVLGQLGQPTAVIHAATCYGRGGEDEARIFAANLEFPKQVLVAARAAGARLFINSDTSLAADLNAYAASKAEFRRCLERQAEAGGVPAVNLRLEHFFGPGDDDSKFVSYLIRSCLNNVPSLDLTAGTQRRDFIHVDDTVSAYLTVLGRAPSQGCVNLDVGSGQAVTVRALVEQIHALSESETQLNFGARPMRANEAMLCEADTRPLQALGWRCRYTLEQGLKRTIEQEKAA